jgi:hypothetical protein
VLHEQKDFVLVACREEKGNDVTRSVFHLKLEIIRHFRARWTKFFAIKTILDRSGPSTSPTNLSRVLVAMRKTRKKQRQGTKHFPLGAGCNERGIREMHLNHYLFEHLSPPTPTWRHKNMAQREKPA